MEIKMPIGSFFKQKVLSVIPSYNKKIYNICKRYVDMYNGDNDVDFLTNGELYLMRRALLECHTVFDIGANVGHWAALALQTNPHLSLHCFEPSHATFQHLLKNQFSSNMICNNFGLSSVHKKTKLFVFEDGSGINSLYKRHGLEDGWNLPPQEVEETIQLETCDEYCNRNNLSDVGIDFCKVDVEGHELEVFKGMSQMLGKRKIKIIQFEYGGCNIDAKVLLKDIFEYFKQFEYTFYKIFPKELRKITRYDQPLENFQFQSWAITSNEYNIDHISTSNK